MVDFPRLCLEEATMRTEKEMLLKDELRLLAIRTRDRLDLTQRQMAEACGVSEGTVSRWERGIKDPTISQAKRIGEICGVHYNDIIFLPKVMV